MVGSSINEVSGEDMQSFVDTIAVVIEAEADGDHIQSLFNHYGTVMKWYNGDILWPENEPDTDDVETALRVARDHLDSTVQTSISLRAREVDSTLPDVTDESLIRI